MYFENSRFIGGGLFMLTLLNTACIIITENQKLFINKKEDDLWDS